MRTTADRWGRALAFQATAEPSGAVRAVATGDALGEPEATLETSMLGAVTCATDDPEGHRRREP